MARAATFGVETDGQIEVEIVSGPSPTGLFIVKDKTGRKLARHRDRLVPLDADARDMLRHDK